MRLAHLSISLSICLSVCLSVYLKSKTNRHRKAKISVNVPQEVTDEPVFCSKCKCQDLLGLHSCGDPVRQVDIFSLVIF